MTPMEDSLFSKRPCSNQINVVVGDSTKLPTLHIRHGLLPIPNRSLHRPDILHVLALKYNLLSINKLGRDNNCHVDFSSSSVYVNDKVTGKTLLQGTGRDGVYPFQPTTEFTSSTALLTLRESREI